MVKNDTFSCIRGYSFTFKDNENHIQAWFSAISGKEKVFVNDELVSTQRNFSRSSVNTFSIDDDVYSTEIDVRNIFKGPFICTLFKNNKPFKRKKLLFHAINKNKRQIFYDFIPYLILGIIMGVAGAYFKLSDVVVYGIIILFVLIHSLYNYKTNKQHYKKPVIVEEKIV